MSSKYLFEWWANDNTSQARSGHNSSQSQSYIKEVKGLYSIIQRGFSFNPTRIKDGKFTLIYGAENKRKWHNTGAGVNSSTDPYINITTLNKDSFVPGAIRIQSYKTPNYYFLGNTALNRKYADTVFIVLRANLVGLINYNSNAFSLYINGQKENMSFGSFNAPIENGFITGITTWGYMTLFHNDWIPDNEIQDLYKEFLNLKPKQKSLSLTNPNKPTLFQETGLIAAYNLKPINNKLINIALPNPANGNNPGQYDWDGKDVISSVAKEGVWWSKKFTTTPLNLGNLGKYHSFCMVFKTTSYNANFAFGHTSFLDRLFFGADQFYYRLNNVDYMISEGIQNKDLIIIVTRNNNILESYTNGIKKIFDLSSNNQDFHIDILRSNMVFPVGRNTLLIKDIKIYNRPISTKEAKDYHNSFVSKPVLQEDFSQYAVGSTKFGNWSLIKTIYTANAWKIDEITKPTKFLQKGTKYLVATGNSINDIKIPSATAYGSWEFITWVDNTTLGSSISFIDSGSGNYRLWLYQGGFCIGKDGGVNLIFNFYPATAGEQLKIKITRSLSGVFKVYVNDIYKGTGTDNSYTTCKLFKINTYSSHFKLANLKIYPGITV